MRADRRDPSSTRRKIARPSRSNHLATQKLVDIRAKTQSDFDNSIPRLCPRYSHILVALYLAASDASAAALTVSIDQREGLPGLSLSRGATSSHFVFWGKKRTWTSLRIQCKGIAPDAISGTDHALNFDLFGRIMKPSRQRQSHYRSATGSDCEQC